MTQAELLELKEKQAGRDHYQQPDFYAIDDLLTEEHKLIRDTVRDWVKLEISPVIDEYFSHCHPKWLVLCHKWRFFQHKYI